MVLRNSVLSAKKRDFEKLVEEGRSLTKIRKRIIEHFISGESPSLVKALECRNLSAMQCG